LFVRRILSKQRLVKIQGEQGCGGIQGTDKGAQNRGKDDGAKDAVSPLRQYGSQQAGISIIGIGERISKHVEGDNARENQEQSADDFEKAYVQRTFLPFLQVSSGQSLLHDHLVRTPVKQVVKEHAEEKRGPGNDFGVDG